ncbi:MAG TPA: hypothetical protein VIC03_12140 [Gemmatimonadaceae bacterium]|jgi:hypothetical protein
MNQRPMRSVVVVLSLLVLAGCSAGVNGPTSPTGVAQFNGSYNFFFKYPSPSGTASRTLTRYLYINGGVVTSSDGLSSGSVSSFGVIRFQTPCPINSSTATWTGNMNASAQSGSNFGQGTYTCSIAIGGGSLDSWQATQTP